MAVLPHLFWAPPLNKTKFILFFSAIDVYMFVPTSKVSFQGSCFLLAFEFWCRSQSKKSSFPLVLVNKTINRFQLSLIYCHFIRSPIVRAPLRGKDGTIFRRSFINAVDYSETKELKGSFLIGPNIVYLRLLLSHAALQMLFYNYIWVTRHRPFLDWQALSIYLTSS